MKATEINRITRTKHSTLYTYPFGANLGIIYPCIAIIFLSLLTACSHDITNILGGNKQIAFASHLNQTRAASFTEHDGINDFKTMGVYAASHGSTDFTGSTSVTLMQNTKLERSNGSNGWYYSPTVSWRGLDKHSFFAYAPYAPTGLTVPSTPNNGIPTMTYAVPTAVHDQTDLLVANALYNLQDTLTTTINLTMNHALTRIVFSARILHQVAPSTTIKITEVKLSNIANTATRPMAFNPTDSWTLIDPNNNKADYTLTNATGGGLQDIALTQSLTPIETTTGNLFLIPQSFTTDDAILSITYVLNDGTTPITNTLNKPIVHFLDHWQQGEAIRLLLTIPNTALPEDFTIDVSYVAWDDRVVDVEIPSDPFLDVTNIEANVYDAAVTRIYFYTNQDLTINGKPNVFIDPVGREGLITGPIFTVNEELHSLSGSPTEASNFHFDNTTGKGHFDLINIHTNTAGDRPNNGKKLLFIKLRAGKLVRDIAVQPIVTTEAAKGDAVPFIGTFHRHNQTGERLITWHLPESTSWTASIDTTTGNHNNLCIDRLASPDYAANALFSHSPRDPEGALVSDEGPTVSGKGRVYFRVGWKTPSPTNRYARVKVTGTNVGGLGINEIILYCRQGETEEQITGAATTLFSVYNTALPRTFTQYPTQIGMLYQWNRIRAWDPLALTAPPGFPTDYETSFSYERSACPEGYLYPDASTLSEIESVLSLNTHQWGYYADGFLDRRAMTVGDHRVETFALNIAAAGILFYTPESALATSGPRSIFLATGGYRTSDGSLTNPGTQAGYWTNTTNASDPSFANTGYFHKNGIGVNTTNTPHKKNHALSLRCVKPAANSAWIVRFEANGGENAPLSITVPKTVGNVTIPTTPPNNYWRENYIFKEWNTLKTGGIGGIAVQPNNTFSPSSYVTTLYAQWEFIVPPIKIVDFRNYATASKYIQTGQPYTSYNSYTTTSNGTTYISDNEILAVSGEKAYPHIEWSPDIEAIAGKKRWADAFNYCKDTYKPDGNNWRLPRAIEMYLVGIGSPVTELNNKISNTIWSGTNASNNKAWTQVVGTAALWDLDKATGGNYSFRCVREIPIP